MGTSVFLRSEMIWISGSTSSWNSPCCQTLPRARLLSTRKSLKLQIPRSRGWGSDWWFPRKWRFVWDETPGGFHSANMDRFFASKCAQRACSVTSEEEFLTAADLRIYNKDCDLFLPNLSGTLLWAVSSIRDWFDEQSLQWFEEWREKEKQEAWPECGSRGPNKEGSCCSARCRLEVKWWRIRCLPLCIWTNVAEHLRGGGRRLVWFSQMNLVETNCNW